MQTTQPSRIPASPPQLAHYLQNTIPWGKQQEAFAWCADRTLSALFMEQRTGKSPVAIGKIVRHFERDEIDAVIIVAMPSGVPQNWIDEIDGNPAEGRPARMPARIRRRCVVWDARRAAQIGYKAALDELIKFDGLAVLAVNGEAILTKAFQTFAARFFKRRRVMAIADETSLIMKDSGTRRFRVMERIKKYTPIRMILDGTPVGEGPLDLFSQMGWLDYAILGHTSFYSYKAHFAALEQKTIQVFDKKAKEVKPRTFTVIREDDEGNKIYLHMDELQERLSASSFRATRKECFDIPEKLYTPYHFDLSPEQRRVYDQLRDEYEAELDGGARVSAPLVLTRYLRLQQITSNYWPSEKTLKLCESCMGEGCERCDDLGAFAAKTMPRIIDPTTNPRLDALADLLSVNRGPVIVWARFTRDIDSVVALASWLGRNPVRYDGTMDADARRTSKTAFQRGESGLIAANQGAAQRGLDLSAAMAHIYYSNDFSGLKRQQTEDRTEVSGRTVGTGIIDLIANDSVDEDIVASHLGKRKLAEFIMTRRSGGIWLR